MSERSTSEDHSLQSAEALFAGWIERLESGDARDLNDLCAAHPEQAEQLRAMHAGWRRLAPVLLLQGEASEAGIDLDSHSSPEGDESGLIERLSARARPFQRYVVEGELGHGGMGVVHRAWDSDLRRPLALKRMREDRAPPRSGERDPARARFLEEARLTGQLDHPGIVPVHELGLDGEGRLYFSMRLVRGRDLSDVFDSVHAGEEGWTQSRAVTAILRACDALSYAHAKGVTHRDLKPSNIRVGNFGEVYVMDWGLARISGQPEVKDIRVRAEPSSEPAVEGGDPPSPGTPLLTVDGDVLGTAAYMSPEQARGELAGVGPHSDVYSMGAILYHLLAGRAPYVGPGERPSPFAIWARVRSGAPVPIELLAPHAPQELCAICQKAMARDPHRRYPHIAAFSKDLLAFQENRVVQAWRTGAVVEFKKWVVRNRGTAASIAAAAVIAFAGLLSTSIVESRGRRQETRWNTELAATNKELGLARDAAESAARTAGSEADEARRQRDSADRVAEFLVNLFGAPDPAESRGHEVTAREILDRGAGRIAASLGEAPFVRARLTEAMAKAYGALGRYAEQERLARELVDLRRAELGPAHRETLASVLLLGDALTNLDRGEEAERLELDALQLARTSLGAADPVLIQGLCALAYTYSRARRLPSAELLYLEASDLAAEANGPENLDALTLENNLATLFTEEGCLDDAREIFEKILPIRRRLLGADHPDTIATLSNLATTYRALGRSEEAAPLSREVLESDTRVLGPEHPDTIGAMDNLAVVLDDLDRREEAETYHRGAVELSTRVLGPTHLCSRIALENFAAALEEQHRYREAESEARELVERTPPDSLDARIAKALLERVRKQLGEEDSRRDDRGP